jgi:hypothetical protein
VRVVGLVGAGLAAMMAIWWFVLGRPAAVPEQLGVPVASGLTPAVVPVGPAPVASSEEHVERPAGSVAIPGPSPISSPASSRRKPRGAEPRAPSPPSAPSARPEAPPPIPPPPRLSGGTFEDRK